MEGGAPDRELVAMGSHLIQFPGKEEYKRAIKALGEVPLTRLGLPDLKMLVMEAHLQALDHSKIPYTDLTKEARNDSETTNQP
jgi:hypothetical protein